MKGCCQTLAPRQGTVVRRHHPPSPMPRPRPRPSPQPTPSPSPSLSPTETGRVRVRVLDRHVARLVVDEYGRRSCLARAKRVPRAVARRSAEAGRACHQEGEAAPTFMFTSDDRLRVCRAIR